MPAQHRLVPDAWVNNTDYLMTRSGNWLEFINHLCHGWMPYLSFRTPCRLLGSSLPSFAPTCARPVRRVVLCTGKVYYDLHARREELGLDKGQVRARAGCGQGWKESLTAWQHGGEYCGASVYGGILVKRSCAMRQHRDSESQLNLAHRWQVLSNTKPPSAPAPLPGPLPYRLPWCAWSSWRPSPSTWCAVS